MPKKPITILFLLFCTFVHAQGCPTLTYPEDGSSGVPVDATITWANVSGVTGYTISLGTTPGGVDIINRRTSGTLNAFKPEKGLPDDSMIYVSIVVNRQNQPPLNCPPLSFSTMDVVTPPACTNLITPFDGQSATPIHTKLEWEYAPTATGYFISVGTSPNGNQVVNNLDVGNRLNYQFAETLELDTEYFVKILPYNENGNAGTCGTESFTTGNVNVNCGPFVNAVTGETFYRGPVIDFPKEIGLCPEAEYTRALFSGQADGYRWYQLGPDNMETLLSEASEARLTQLGHYRLEVYNLITQGEISGECSTVWDFKVVPAKMAEIKKINVIRNGAFMDVHIEVNEPSQFEYALDSPDGIFQDEPYFYNVRVEEHTVFVRDKFGCAVTDKLVERNLSADDFPKFFTPNNDHNNDFWQYIPPVDSSEFSIEIIHIYDRYGNLLKELFPQSIGWDGNYQGSAAPQGEYWFRAISGRKQVISGHFSLKR